MRFPLYYMEIIIDDTYEEYSIVPYTGYKKTEISGKFVKNLTITLRGNPLFSITDTASGCGAVEIYDYVSSESRATVMDYVVGLHFLYDYLLKSNYPPYLYSTRAGKNYKIVQAMDLVGFTIKVFGNTAHTSGVDIQYLCSYINQYTSITNYKKHKLINNKKLEEYANSN